MDENNKKFGKGGKDGGSESAATSSVLTEYAAKVSFFTRSGADIINGISVPGMFVSDWCPALGRAKAKTDPINQAMIFAYRENRSKNSGAKNYGPADMGLIDLCIDSLTGCWYSVRRAMRQMKKVTAHNMYYGKYVVEALGFDYDSLVDNQPALEYRMGVWKSSIEKIARIPTMAYSAAHTLLNTGILRDGASDRAQLYMFRQRYYYYYDKADQAKGVTLLDIDAEYRKPGESTTAPHLMTYEDIVDLMDRMYFALINSDDFALITGDFEKCWGERAFTTLPEVDAEKEEEYLDGSDVLVRIMNAVYVGDVFVDSFRLEDKGGYYAYDPQAAVPPVDTDEVNRQPTAEDIAAIMYDGSIVNSITPDPSPKDVAFMLTFNTRVDYSRWVDAQIGPANVPISALGTEVLTQFRMYSIEDDQLVGGDAPLQTNFVYDTDYAHSPIRSLTGDKLLPITMAQVVSRLAQFDWHPAVNPIPGTQYGLTFFDLMPSGYVDPQYIGLPICDLNVYTTIDDEVVRKILEAIVLTAVGILK